MGYLTKYMKYMVKFCLDHGGLHWACVSQLKGLHLYPSLLGKRQVYSPSINHPSPTVFWWGKPSTAGVTVPLQN